MKSYTCSGQVISISVNLQRKSRGAALTFQTETFSKSTSHHKPHSEKPHPTNTNINKSKPSHFVIEQHKHNSHKTIVYVYAKPHTRTIRRQRRGYRSEMNVKYKRLEDKQKTTHHHPEGEGRGKRYNRCAHARRVKTTLLLHRIAN